MSRANQKPNTPAPSVRRSRSRKRYGLASKRDRTRLRERTVAERARVEQMLATAPIVEEQWTRTRRSTETVEANPLMGVGRSRAGRGFGLARSCPVCGDARIVTDEVIHGGTLSMSECLHCDHRWTMRPKARWADLGTRMIRRGTPAGARDYAPATTHPRHPRHSRHSQLRAWAT